MNEKQSNSISKQSSKDDIRSTSDAVFDRLGEALFDKINYVSNPFSKEETNIVDTSDYHGVSRITDTADGRFLKVGLSSRMKCSFYLTQYTKLDGYLLSPVVYDSYSSLNTLSSTASLRAFTGLRFLDGKIYTVSKEAGGKEKLREVNMTIAASEYTDTMLLEIKHNVSSTEIYLNSKLIHTVSSDMVGTFSTQQTYLPFLSLIKSTDGTGVNITAENIQFIQNKF